MKKVARCRLVIEERKVCNYIYVYAIILKYWSNAIFLIKIRCRMDKDGTLKIEWSEWRDYLLLSPSQNINEILQHWRHASVSLLAWLILFHIWILTWMNRHKKELTTSWLYSMLSTTSTASGLLHCFFVPGAVCSHL